MKTAVKASNGNVFGTSNVAMNETAKMRNKFPSITSRVEHIMKEYPQYANDYNLVFVIYKIVFENAEIKSKMHESEGKGFFESMLDLMTTGATYTAVERARRRVIGRNRSIID